MLLALLILSAGLIGCGEEELVDPVGRVIGPAGKPAPSGDPNVSTTDPTGAPQDTTLDVRVLGSNFDRGSRADLALDCEVACQVTEKVRTNSTRFISASELVANITIAADATVELYDVLVTTSKGKRGIGIELFAISLGHPNPQTNYTKVVLDRLSGSSSCDGEGLNDALEVVGHCFFKSGPRRAFMWRPGAELRDLGAGQALNISDFGGPVIVGFVGDAENPRPAVWENGSGPAVELPGLSGEGCTKGQANGVDSQGDRVVGGACSVSGGSQVWLPVIWNRDGNSWSDPQVLPLAPQYTNGRALDISPNGVIIGILGPYQDGAGGEYFAWFPPYTAAERIPPGGFTYILVWGVNDQGDVAGTTTENPGWQSLLWRRSGTGWDPPLPIGNGDAVDVNGSGSVAGRGGNIAYVWTPSTGRVELGLVNHIRGMNEYGDVVGRLKNNAIVWVAPR